MGKRCAARTFLMASRLIGWTNGGMNSTLHAATDALGRPLRIFLTASQRSDYIGARALLSDLPPPNTCLQIAVTTRIGIAKPLKTGGLRPAFPRVRGVGFQFYTTQIDTRNATK